MLMLEQKLPDAQIRLVTFEYFSQMRGASGPLIDFCQEPERKGCLLFVGFGSKMLSVFLKGGLHVWCPALYDFAVEHKKLGKVRRQFEIIVEADNRAVRVNTRRVMQDDLEATRKVETLPVELPLSSNLKST